MEKQVLITGAGKGIGRALVKAFIKKGNYRVLAVTRNEKALALLEAECREESGSVPVCLSYDITEESSRQSIYEAVKKGGKLDILVNNAGILEKKPYLEIQEEGLYRTLQVNLMAPFLLSSLLVPLMEQGSHIVNISSMGGVQGSSKFPGLSAYSASKGGLAVLTECMAMELSPGGIAVNCLALGAVQTEMLSAAFPGYDAPVKASQMADFILQFAEEGRKLFNGKILPVSLSTP